MTQTKTFSLPIQARPTKPQSFLSPNHDPSGPPSCHRQKPGPLGQASDLPEDTWGFSQSPLVCTQVHVSSTTPQ